MLRWPLRILLITLLITCATFWIRSHWVPEIVLHEETTREGRSFTTRQCVLLSAKGGVFLGYRHNVSAAADDAQADKRAAEPARNGWFHQHLEKDVAYGGWFFQKLGKSTPLGFGHHSQEITSDRGLLKMQSYVFPYAAPTVVLSLLPMWWIFRAFLPAPQKPRKLIASPEFADNDYLRSPTEPFAPRT